MDLHRPLIHGLVLSLVLLPATSLAASGGPSACVPDRTSGAGDSAPLGASAEEEAGAGVIAWDLDGDGVQARVSDGQDVEQVYLSLERWGRPGRLACSSAVARTDVSGGVDLQRPGITESLRVTPGGRLEHSFEIHQRPPTDPSGDSVEPLLLVMRLPDDWLGRATEDSKGCVLQHRSKPLTLRYDGLAAWDSEMLNLPCWMDVVDSEVHICVLDVEARYPIQIDPVLMVEDAKLEISTLTGTALLGTSVSLSGDTVVVGATSETTIKGTSSGAAHVFVRNMGSWSEQATLLGSLTNQFDRLGCSVAIDGDTALVGAYQGDNSTMGGGAEGIVYVFDRNSSGVWSQTAGLDENPGAGADQLGFSVDLDGDTAIVGVPDPTDSGGRALIFTRTLGTWTYQATLTPATGGGHGDWFGGAVAISGDTAVVGAWNVNMSAGSAYVYKRTGSVWSQEAALVGTGVIGGSRFGASVAIDGDRIAIGSDSSEFAHVFHRSGSTWSEEAMLTACDTTSPIGFGSSVGVSGNRVVVGAEGKPIGATGAGAVYSVLMEGIDPPPTQYILHASDPGNEDLMGDLLGSSVAVEGGRVVAGAPFDNIHGMIGGDEGSAYVFELAVDPATPLCFGDGCGFLCPCGNNSVLGAGEGCLNSLGVGAVITATGTNVVSNDDLVLHASQARPDKTGVFLQGGTYTTGVFRDGLLCVGNPTERLEFVTIDSAGSVSTSVSIVTEGMVSAGDQRYYQFWYRDGMGPCDQGSNLSNALKVEWE